MMDDIAHGIGRGQMPVNGCRVVFTLFSVAGIIRRLLRFGLVRLLFHGGTGHKRQQRTKQYYYTFHFHTRNYFIK